MSEAHPLAERLYLAVLVGSAGIAAAAAAAGLMLGMPGWSTFDSGRSDELLAG